MDRTIVENYGDRLSGEKKPDEGMPGLSGFRGGPGGGKKLTVKQKLGFGIFDLGGNMFFTLMSFWALKYLTDVVGLAAAVAGSAVMVGKAWDAVSDPLMGYISDRTRTRWGRRRVYLLFGALPMGITMIFFFTAPGYLPASLHAAWAVLALVLLNTAATVINVPYASLTPELTDDYDEQSSLNGYRFGCAVFGTIAGAGAVQPLVAAFARPGAANATLDPRGFAVTGAILGAVMSVATLLTFFGTREKPRPVSAPAEAAEGTAAEAGGFFASYACVFRNKPFLILIATYALHMTGISFLTSILSYYTENVLRRPEITTIAMVLLLVTAMVFIPVSVLVSKKIGKKKTYQICFMVISIACAVIYFFGHRMEANHFFAVMVFAGVGVGFSYVAPFALVPDTIEYRAMLTGERREGAYYGIWTFVSKLGTAAALFVTGFVLQSGGYVQSSAGSGAAVLAANSAPGVTAAIRLLIGPLPVVVLLAAALVVQFYPLDDERYRRALGGR